MVAIKAALPQINKLRYLVKIISTGLKDASNSSNEPSSISGLKKFVVIPMNESGIETNEKMIPKLAISS